MIKDIESNSKSISKKIRKLYGFSFSAKDGKVEIKPSKIDPLSKELIPVKFTTDIQRQFNNFMTDMVNSEDLRNRLQRYADLEFMINNSGMMFLAVTIISQETVSPNESGKVIEVFAKNPKVEKSIYKLFNRIGINKQFLEAISWDISLVGDAFCINTIDPIIGITEVTLIDYKDIKDKLEFNASREINKDKFKFSNSTIHTSMSQLIDALSANTNDVDYGSMFKNYLLGYVLTDGTVLPPWSVTHFKRTSTKNEFSPFGKPQLIHSLALFRQLKSAQNLLSMARVSKFPKEIFKVFTSEDATEAQKWAAVNSARQDYYNFISQDTGREENSIGGAIWTVDGLIEYDLQQNTMDLGDIADVEMMENDLITSTTIPKDYLIQNGSTWGSSEKALTQQSKVFSRNSYINQSSILAPLNDLVKMHFAITGEYDKEDTEFELSLCFPSSDVNDSNRDALTASMDLAQTIIDNLQTALAVDSLPKDVVISIFKKYSFMSGDHLDFIIDAVENTPKEELMNGDDEYDTGDDYDSEDESMDSGEDDVFGSDDSGGEDDVFGSDEEIDSGDDSIGPEDEEEPEEDDGGIEDIINASTIKDKDKRLAEKAKLTEQKIKSRLSENICREVYFKSKREMCMSESIRSNRHWYFESKTDDYKSKLYSTLKTVYRKKSEKLDD